MANPFNIPDSPFDIYPRDSFPCDSECQSLSDPSLSLNASGFVNANSLLSESYFSGVHAPSITGCFLENGNMLVLYKSGAYNSTNKYGYIAFEGVLQGSNFSPNRVAFLNYVNRVPPNKASQQAYITCDLVPISDIVYIPPETEGIDFNVNYVLLPATILASLFFIWVYKVFKKVLFR